eukprot:899300-Pyramimonas_sp.AAC.1
MSAAERSRHKMFATAIKESEGEEFRRKEMLVAKRQAIKDDLENQMRVRGGGVPPQGNACRQEAGHQGRPREPDEIRSLRRTAHSGDKEP